MTQEFDLLRDRVACQFAHDTPKTIGVAVSGGSDSLGLLTLLVDWSKQGGPKICAATVDHGLRPESAQEAQHVARVCESFGVPHATLHWCGGDRTGNLQDRARRARYDLLTGWAEESNLEMVAVAHTLNDQAETFLMRLARESGVDGLSAMKKNWRRGSIQFVRPTLQVSRDELRDVLRERQIDWINDPSNDDESQERARVRRVFATLQDVGISPRKLARVSRRMADVRNTLYWYVFLAAQEHVSFHEGDVRIVRPAFRILAVDVARRLLQEVLQWISGAEYPPRGRALDLMMEAIRGGTGMSLHGCIMKMETDHLHFTREMRAVEHVTCAPDGIWDGRWKLEGPWPQNSEVRCLGVSGLSHCENWKETGMPARSLHASPAVWSRDYLIAAPLAGYGDGWSAKLLRDEEQFFANVLTH